MFTVTQKIETGFSKIILTDKKGKCSAEILPECGAILNAFTILNNDNTINIIEGYKNQDDFNENCESKGFRSAKLSPFVCRLKNGTYFFKKNEYKVNGFYLDKHALHGLIYRKIFSIVKTKKLKNSAWVLLRYKYRADDNGYPFPFNCDLKYTLKKNNRLIITTTISNKGKSKIPVSDGWHPYFTLGRCINDLAMQMYVSGKLVFDNELLPTGKTESFKQFEKPTPIGETVFDNCFIVKKGAKTALQLTNVENGITLKIKPHSAYPYLQIYTPPQRQSIAIENLSSAPDAFNNKMGLVVLDKNKSKKFITEYIVNV